MGHRQQWFCCSFPRRSNPATRMVRIWCAQSLNIGMHVTSKNSCAYGACVPSCMGLLQVLRVYLLLLAININLHSTRVGFSVLLQWPRIHSSWNASPGWQKYSFFTCLGRSFYTSLWQLLKWWFSVKAQGVLYWKWEVYVNLYDSIMTIEKWID